MVTMVTTASSPAGLLSCCTDKELVSRYRKSRDTIAALKLRVGFSHHVEVGVTRECVSQYGMWHHVWGLVALAEADH